MFRNNASFIWKLLGVLHLSTLKIYQVENSSSMLKIQMEHPQHLRLSIFIRVIAHALTSFRIIFHANIILYLLYSICTQNGHGIICHMHYIVYNAPHMTLETLPEDTPCLVIAKMIHLYRY